MELYMITISLCKMRHCKKILFGIIILVCVVGMIQKQSYLNMLTKYSRNETLDVGAVQNEYPTTENAGQGSSPNTGPTPIILQTYMRSGSSFLGEIIQAHDDVFYMFEPLRLTQFRIRAKKKIPFVNGSMRAFGNFLDVASLTLTDLSSCNLDKVSLRTWEDGFLDRSRKASMFRKCLWEQLSPNRTENQRMKICLEKLTRVCQESKVLLFKVIRVPLSILLPMMAEIPNLKIVYLLRDPRATARSQRSYGLIKERFLKENITTFCNRVYDDVVMAEVIQRLYPTRILTLFYEDMTYDPLKYSQIIYSFAGLDFSTIHRDVVKNMTSSTVSKNCQGMCTMRNSTEQAEKWRLSVDMNFVQAIDQCCKQLYQKVGYNEIPSKELLRNLNYRLRKTPLGMGDYRFA